MSLITSTTKRRATKRALDILRLNRMADASGCLATAPFSRLAEVDASVSMGGTVTTV
jgi:hypothetical protein